MKYVVVFFMFLLLNGTQAQITWQSLPLNKQLVGRDPATNLGNIAIEGEADQQQAPYDSILLEVLRNNVLQQKHSQALTYTNQQAPFSFNISIVAELANYSLKIYGKTGTIKTLEKQLDSIVAGDAFIIQGQSNAEAPMMSGSANGHQHQFIRVFANGTHFPDSLQENNHWYIGEGDGNRNTNGNAGQWGLTLAHMLMDSLHIPIAIFNCGHGGKNIAFFQAAADYQTSLASNYGRLYYRLVKTGLKDFVRAVYWSQGAWDGENYANTSTLEYKNYFLSLKNDWLRDYPALEHFYIFQTKNGCGGMLHKVKEAQRQLAFEHDSISIIPTAALTHVEDDCHFPYTNGYERFATRLFPLVLRDLYGIPSTQEIDPPMIQSAYMRNDTTLVVSTDAHELFIQTVAEDFQLSSGASSVIRKTETADNELIFTLSKNPGTAASISYLAQDSAAGNFITNQAGLELICFYQFPITNNTFHKEEADRSALKVYPNPTNGLIFVEWAPTVEVVHISVLNFMGREVAHKAFPSNKLEWMLLLPDGMYILIIEDKEGKRYSRRMIKN